MSKRMVILAFSIFVFVLAGCMPRVPTLPKTLRDFTDEAEEIYVLNSLSETVSIINPSTREIYSDVITTGAAPNDIMYYSNRLYIVNSLDNDILVLDEDTFEDISRIYLGKGKNPWTIIQKGDSEFAYVPNFTDASVSLVNLISGALVTNFAVGGGPEGGAYLNGKLYVCNTGWNYATYTFDAGMVSVVDGNTHATLATVSVKTNPQMILAVTNTGTLHVICTGKNGGLGSDDGYVSVIDAGTDLVITNIYVGGSPGAYAVDHTTKTVYLAGVGGVSSYRYDTYEVLHSSTNYILTATSESFYSSVAVDVVRGLLYVSDMTGDVIRVVRLSDEALIDTIDGSDGAGRLRYVVE